MDFFKNLRDFFIPRVRDPHRSFPEDDRNDRHHRPSHHFPDERHNSGHYEDEYNNFPIYSNPLEMHKYFEQQMNHMLREFSTFGFGSSFPDHSDFGPFLEDSRPQRPMIERPKLRDEYLKPGYDKQRDNDLDNHDIDELFKDKPSMLHPKENTPMVPSRQFQPKIYSFGHQSMSSSIMLPNGVVEHTRKVADSHGNVETTHTRMIGDQKYSITRKKNSEGQEEQIEDFQNMEENHLPQFEEKWKTLKSNPIRIPALPSKKDDDRPPLDQFPFDKFFK